MSKTNEKYLRITIDLSASEIVRLDRWIDSKPLPRPSRVDAIRSLLAPHLRDSDEVAYLRVQFAQADQDVREQFDRVLGMIDRLAEGEPFEPPPAKKLN